MDTSDGALLCCLSAGDSLRSAASFRARMDERVSLASGDDDPRESGGNLAREDDDGPGRCEIGPFFPSPGPNDFMGNERLTIFPRGATRRGGSLEDKKANALFWLICVNESFFGGFGAEAICSLEDEDMEGLGGGVRGKISLCCLAPPPFHVGLIFL